MQGNIMVPFITWPLIQSESAQVAADECEAVHEATWEATHEKLAHTECDALYAHL